jgi:hypothetical protein
MSDLDELIKNLMLAANEELDKHPLLTADTYKNIDFKTNNQYTGHIYLGVLGAWLYKNKYLTENFYQTKFQYITPAEISMHLLSGNLYRNNITVDMLDFCEYYITNLYPIDYQNEVVSTNGLFDMSEVKNLFSWVEGLYKKIENRYQAYKKNDPSWKDYPKKLLPNININYLSLNDWKQSLLVASTMEEMSHNKREQQLANFWHLLDLAEHDNNPETPKFILTLLNSKLHDDLKRSLVTRLTGFPFENSLDAIFFKIDFLKKINYLNDALGAWGGDYTEYQLNILVEKFDSLDQASKNTLLKIAASPQNYRAKWARKFLDL